MRKKEPVPQLTISTLGGVADAEIDGKYIVGHWENPTQWIRWRYLQKQITLAEKFLNWDDTDSAILRFVLKYGPVARDQLHQGFGKELQYKPVIPSDGAPFRMQIESWRLWRDQMHQGWKTHMEVPQATWSFNVLAGEFLRFDPERGLEFQGLNPTRFVYAVVLSCPWDRKRICPRPDCKSRYFIARHRGALYCSAPCADWAQKETKKKWWHEHRGGGSKKLPRK